MPTLIAPGSTNFVGSVVKLKGYDDTYLFVARPVDPEVLEYMRLADQTITEYRQYASNRLVFQITFALMYFGVAFVFAARRALARHCARQPFRLANPQPDDRRQPHVDRRSQGRRADYRKDRGPARSQHAVQPDDAAAQATAPGAGPGIGNQREAPPVYRGRARRRQRRHCRP
nr:hypothetical protein [uncultured Sphaerochaeta sp.]